MNSTTLLLASVFTTIFCLTLGLSLWYNRDRSLQKRMDDMHSHPSGPNAEVKNPSSWQAVAAKVGPIFARLATPKEGGQVSDLRLRFYHAGLRQAAWLPAFVVTKVALALVFPAVLVLFGGFTAAKVISASALASLVLLCAMGYYLPNAVLNFLVNRRQREIQEAMPDAIDLLTICVEAGLGIDAAMRKTGSELGLRSKALAEELDLVVLELQVGASRETAMHNFSMRTGVEDVAVFVTILLQSEHFGSNMADSLRIHSETMRDKRTQRAEEIAAKIPIKLLFPTLFFIFPSIFIVLLGPAAIGISRTLLPSMGGSH